MASRAPNRYGRAMRLAFAASILAVAAPAGAQIAIGPIGPIGVGREPNTQSPDRQTTAPQTSSPRRPGRLSAKTAYGYRLTIPDEDDDPTDRRVLRRLNTRLNNRLETRIERYRFVDTKSDRAGRITRNPYAPRPTADTVKPALMPRERAPEEPR